MPDIDDLKRLHDVFLGIAVLALYIAFPVNQVYYPQTYRTQANATAAVTAWPLNGQLQPAGIASAVFVAFGLFYFIWTPYAYWSVWDPLRWRCVASFYNSEAGENLVFAGKMMALTCLYVAYFADTLDTVWWNTSSTDPLYLQSVILFSLGCGFLAVSWGLKLGTPYETSRDFWELFTINGSMVTCVALLCAAMICGNQKFILPQSGAAGVIQNTYITQAQVWIAFMGIALISLFADLFAHFADRYNLCARAGG